MTKDWQAERDKIRADFLRNWDWVRVLSTWRKRMKELGVHLNPLFTEVVVWDPKDPDREEKLSWWAPDAIRENQKVVQRHFIQFPGTRGSEHANRSFRQGEIDTLHYFWKHRDEPNNVAAVLIAGSLFGRMGYRRGRYPHDYWPHIAGVSEVEGWAVQQIGGRERWGGWHFSCTDVLPLMSEDWQYKIESLHALIRYLAEEHAALLHSYRPVVLRFASTPDPFIYKELEAERREQLVQQKKRREERSALEVEENAELNRLKEKHPRYGKWGNLHGKDLRALVWTKPTTEIAREFGVSDVAVAKRCKAQGIPKPAPGFWAKVAAGTIPHPQGRPMDSQGRLFPEPPPHPKPTLKLVKTRSTQE